MKYCQPDLSSKAASQRLLDLVSSISHVDYDTSWDLCNAHLKKLGVDSVFYGFYTSLAEVKRQGMTQSCLYRTNHNPKWLEAIGVDTLLDNEITASLILDDAKEIIWSDEQLWESATAEQHEQSSFEDELGMDTGVTLQLSSLRENPVGVGVGLCTSGVSVKEFGAYWDHQRAEVYNTCQIMDLAIRTNHTADFLNLSAREIEFLEYLAAGYTLKQLAISWNRALSTLNSHSLSCRQKLKASSLEQAVFRAYVLGLIRP